MPPKRKTPAAADAAAPSASNATRKRPSRAAAGDKPKPARISKARTMKETVEEGNRLLEKAKKKDAAKAKAKAKAEGAGHPAYKDMITTAIIELKNRKGSSAQAIGKYILNNYHIDGGAHLRVALKRGVDKEIFVRDRASYRLGPKNKKKKPAAAKKAADGATTAVSKAKKAAAGASAGSAPAKKAASAGKKSAAKGAASKPKASKKAATAKPKAKKASTAKPKSAKKSA